MSCGRLGHLGRAPAGRRHRPGHRDPAGRSACQRAKGKGREEGERERERKKKKAISDTIIAAVMAIASSGRVARASDIIAIMPATMPYHHHRRLHSQVIAIVVSTSML